MERSLKDTALISFGMMHIAMMTVIFMIVSLMCIQMFLDNQEMKKVIENISIEREVTYTKPEFKKVNRKWLDGYYSAMSDKRNIKVFRRFFNSNNIRFIFDYFEERECEIK